MENLRLFARAVGLLFSAVVLVVAADRGHAEEARPLKGVALVVGNSTYEHLPALANPANDARAVEMLLSALGFETTLSSDRDARRLARDLDIFLEDAEGTDVAILYYAGHGIEAGGENFLVPVDADLSALEAAGEKLVPISAFIEQLQATVPVTIVMLDACRDNPFPAGSPVRLGEGSPQVAMGEGGLAETRGATRIAPAATARPADNFGTVIAFAAAPGRVALDGAPGGNSPYAAAVLRHLEIMAGEEFGTVMRMVAEEVYLKTAGRQRPWVNESLRRLLYFGSAPQPVSGVEGEILTERRQLLVTISALPMQGRSLVESVAGERGVPMDALFAMLNTLGEDLPDDPAELDRLLRRLAGDLKGILEERSALRSTDPEILRLSQLAETATAEGALTTAVALYEQAKARVAELSATLDRTEEDLRQRRIEYAGIYGDSGRTRALALDYLGAAEDFALAAREIGRWDDEAGRRYRLAEARALIDHGVIRGGTPALERAVAALDELARETEGALSAEVRLTLADALVALGERQTVNEALERAIVAYRGLLEGGLDFDRAAATRKLGGALLALGRREAGTGRLEEARAALEAALTLHPRATAGSAWAAIRVDLGQLEIAMRQRRDEGLAGIDRAIAHYRAALEELDQTATPAAWASAQIGFGKVLHLRGRAQEGGAGEWSRRSVEALDAALRVCARDTYPVCWATAHHSRGVALFALGSGERDSNTSFSYYRQSLVAFENALSEHRLDMAPVDWAETYRSRAEMLDAFASRSAGGIRDIYWAVAAQGYRDALAAISPESLPVLWFELNNSLADALPSQRLHHLRAALDGFEPADDPARWARQKLAIAERLRFLGRLSSGSPENLSEAVATYEEAAAIFRELGDMPAWAEAWQGRARALERLGKDTASPELVLAALHAYGDVRSHEEGGDAPGRLADLHRARTIEKELAENFEPAVLERAVARLRETLTPQARAQDALGWARGQSDLARLLRALAIRSDDAALLPQAAAAWRAALEVWTPDDHPARFGHAQGGLGDLMKLAAEKAGGIERFHEAAAAYEAALQGLSAERAPFEHLLLLRTLAGMLDQSVGRPHNDNDSLGRAIGHYRAAAAMIDVDTNVGNFVEVQRAIGSAERELHWRGAGVGHAAASVEAYRTAAGAGSAQNDGRGWPSDHHDLAISLVALGEAADDMARLREAFGRFEAALEIWAADGKPVEEAFARSNYGRALFLLGSREKDVGLLERAAAAQRQAMTVLDRSDYPDNWVWAAEYLGRSLAELTEIDGRDAGEAMEIFRGILELRPRETHAWMWAAATYNLAHTMLLDDGTAREEADFEQAVRLARSAEPVFAGEGRAYVVGLVRKVQCDGLTGLARARGDAAALREAVEACRSAASLLDEHGTDGDREKAHAALEEALAALAEMERKTDR